MQPTSPASARRFTIASWNLHMGLRNGGGMNDVVTECKRLDADVLVLQEAWWWGSTESALTQEVADTLGGELHQYVSPTPFRRYPAEWCVAIISRLPAERLKDRLVPALPNKERAMVRLRLTELDLTIAGAHLDGIHAARTRPDIWMRQRAHFGETARLHDVVLGDLNMWGPVVERDAAPLRRAVRGRTWPAWKPHSQIDHILIGDRLRCVEASVAEDCGSDHRAVRATLELR